jgi:RNA polymerase sigma-70 factor (ECF subfamily)
MGQRLSRAKAKIRDAAIPFAIPDANEWPDRIGWVLEAIYGAFAIAHDEAFAEDPFGRGLAEEAIWLARVVASLTADEPEPLGLLALFLFIRARSAARRDALGRYVPLLEQDPTKWDSSLIDEAEALLLKAARGKKLGRFQLEAAIQSAHCVRRRGVSVAWTAIALLYERLKDFVNSRVIEINRAMAIANADDLKEALALLAAVEVQGELEEFQPFWAAKAELHARAGLRESSRTAYDRAIGLERDPAVREFLLAKRARVAR